MAYENLNWVEGTKNLPGFKRNAFYIPKSQISAWPVLDEAGADATARTTYATAFAIDANTWKKAQVIQRKGSLTSEAQGEPESASVMNKLSVIHAGTEEEAVDMQRQANRDDLVWIVEDMQGKYRVVGHKDFRSITKVNVNIGGEATAEKGTTIEVECTDVCLPFYDHEIVTDDGTLNPQV